ncbi:hypothetical protein C2845_PM09G00030 [Panicum miliaceum]|uniref:RNase H type-1 domain-containing protein n=1 Tax=Panicum miliaceum TaxID=4540 RepID=A0A3L6S050_PANMI|nr:hypothetical protein C2845_PM09G00030 [Panicum miliaceum]
MKCGTQKLVISLLWAWWNGRNKANVGAPAGASVHEIIHRAVVFSSDTLQKVNDGGIQSTAGRREIRKWHPPPADVLKINTDGAFKEKEKSGAWGFVIRDSDGYGFIAGAGRLRALYDALSAEGEACLAALHAAMDAVISRIILETDSFLLVSAIKSSDLDLGPGVIFKEIRELLSLHFTPKNIVHVPRSCNNCAYELAHSGLLGDPNYPIVGLRVCLVAKNF